MTFCISSVMEQAIHLARRAPSSEIPVAAILTDIDGGTLSSAVNNVETADNPIAHAELLALTSLGLSRLKEERGKLIMFVTLEPCPMCAWAIRRSGIRTLVYGSKNEVYGAAGSHSDLLRDGGYFPKVEVIGPVKEAECDALIKTAFTKIRNNVTW